MGKNDVRNSFLSHQLLFIMNIRESGLNLNLPF